MSAYGPLWEALGMLSESTRVHATKEEAMKEPIFEPDPELELAVGLDFEIVFEPDFEIEEPEDE